MSQSNRAGFSRTVIALTLLTLFVFSMAPQIQATQYIIDDDGGPGVDFTNIYPAVVAASDGDVLIVRNGTYGSFSLNKALAIVADTGHYPKIDWDKHSRIYDIPQGRTAVLCRFNMPYNCSLRVHDCDGHVMIDDCYIHSGYNAFPALGVYRSKLVTLTRSEVSAPSVDEDMPASYRAIDLEDSTMIVSQCVIEGADGGSVNFGDGLNGVSAVIAKNSNLFFQSSSARGGHGGESYSYLPIGYGGDGAPGIYLDKSYLELFGMDDNVIEGGWEGMGPAGMGMIAYAVEAKLSEIVYSGCTFKTYGMPDFGLTASTATEIAPDVPIIRLHGSGQLDGYIQPDLHSQPGANFVLFASPIPAANQLGQLHAYLHLHPVVHIPLVGGVIPAEGSIYYSFYLPNDPTLRGSTILFQASFLLPGGIKYLSTSAGFAIH